MRSARLIEPEKRYIDPLERLWMTCGDALQYRVERTWAEKAQYRESNTDLAMFCQCLFRIQPHLRAEVLARAWRALRRGGVLLVNEALRDESTPEPKRAGQVLKDDLIDMMPRNVRLFR